MITVHEHNKPFKSQLSVLYLTYNLISISVKNRKCDGLDKQGMTVKQTTKCYKHREKLALSCCSMKLF